MRIKNSEYFVTGVRKDQYPVDDFKEIAFVGRSNVGKSSLINLICNNKKLARTSGKPGKTRTINFYKINQSFYFVDLPGYGYAQVSKDLQKSWGKMIEGYLSSRPNLMGVVLLVDIRHKPSKEDLIMMDYLRKYGQNVLVVCTKGDKVSRGARPKYLSVIKEELNVGDENIVITSTLKRYGLDELVDVIGVLLGEE